MRTQNGQLEIHTASHLLAYIAYFFTLIAARSQLTVRQTSFHRSRYIRSTYGRRASSVAGSATAGTPSQTVCAIHH